MQQLSQSCRQDLATRDDLEDVLTDAEMISMMYGVAMAGNDEELEGRDHLGGQD